VTEYRAGAVILGSAGTFLRLGSLKDARGSSMDRRMSRFSFSLLCRVVAAAAGLAAAAAAPADPLSVVQMLREGGCGGLVPAVRPLHRDASLDRAAEQWAAGRSLSAAAGGGGYSLKSAQGLRWSGSDEALIRLLRPDRCRMVSDRELRDVGVFHRGADTWLVLASPAEASAVPAATRGAPAAIDRAPQVPAHTAAGAAASPLVATRALQLVNEARARGARCGGQAFAPAPPLTLSGALGGVALGHATDMAVHDYFEHRDLSGHSPADRVRAVGYHEKLVGENIAYGAQSVEEAVQGWLDSPGHCQNIMDPRFAEMGIALATGRAARRGPFWVQVLAEPQA
jgi:uncharacterized protein YkwD